MNALQLLINKYENEIDMAKFNVDNLINNPVGVAEHPDLLETIETELLPAVHSLLQIAFLIPNLFGSMIVVFFGDSYSTREILQFAAYCFLSLGIIRLVSKDVREFYTRTPKKIKRTVDNN